MDMNATDERERRGRVEKHGLKSLNIETVMSWGVRGESAVARERVNYILLNDTQREVIKAYVISEIEERRVREVRCSK